MMTLTNKQIVLGVTGGIAAYKSADLVRRLKEAGAAVQVVMTQGAEAFVTPLTFQALSGNPVHTTLFDTQAEAAMGHIQLAKWADCILVAPASANFMAKLTYGHGDDLLTTLCLATKAPIAIVPAMNQQMWHQNTTQSNREKLAEQGVLIWGPKAGIQACGDTGLGRMLEPSDIVEMLGEIFQTGFLAGSHILITAGPTEEDIDPVRFISNRSSGKMGFAIAEAAVEAGAKVTLVSGPVHLETPTSVTRVNVRTALMMRDEVMNRIDGCDIFIAAAAVADYRCKSIATEKIAKSSQTLALELIQNPDIVAQVAALANKPFVVGFAAQTSDLVMKAQEKLKKKKCDMIAANLVGTSTQGFDAQFNALTLLWEEGRIDLPLATKPQLARSLMKAIKQRYIQYACYST